jgi:hypothetical protein
MSTTARAGGQIACPREISQHSAPNVHFNEPFIVAPMTHPPSVRFMRPGCNRQQGIAIVFFFLKE